MATSIKVSHILANLTPMSQLFLTITKFNLIGCEKCAHIFSMLIFAAVAMFPFQLRNGSQR